MKVAKMLDEDLKILRKKAKYDKSGMLNHLVTCYETIFDNACDETSETLEFKPEILAAMEACSLPNKIYSILVKECGANESERLQFLLHFPTVTEFRFRGNLGFGGKFWKREPMRVTCYAEDETPERLAIIERVNEQLSVFNM